MTAQAVKTDKVLDMRTLQRVLSILVKAGRLSSGEADRVWGSIRELTIGSALKVLGKSQLVEEVRKVLDDRDSGVFINQEPATESIRR
ncbi:hypothetical protein J4450_04405 [Candidatus Micrarchaeota archaeon]|nr:hypothetical protein [Candidatus Micrarchaeota archaeon]